MLRAGCLSPSLQHKADPATHGEGTSLFLLWIGKQSCLHPARAPRQLQGLFCWPEQSCAGAASVFFVEIKTTLWKESCWPWEGWRGSASPGVLPCGQPGDGCGPFLCCCRKGTTHPSHLSSTASPLCVISQDSTSVFHAGHPVLPSAPPQARQVPLPSFPCSHISATHPSSSLIP